MNTQPTALRLAEWFESELPLGWMVKERAAAELRRLHEVNQELLEALKYHQDQTRPIQQSIDAIAKAQEQK